MPNHHKELVEDTVRISTSTTENFRKAPIQRWILLIALAAFVISFVLYLCKFHSGFSTSQEEWGQFGDFMGGLINPIVGLCTIWLITVSLNQSHEALHQTALALSQSEAALKQSGAEIVLARQALQDNQRLQQATEAALSRQTLISEEARDMNNAIALWTALNGQRAIATELRDASTKTEEEFNRADSMVAQAQEGLIRLEAVMGPEIDRLHEKYSVT